MHHTAFSNGGGGLFSKGGSIFGGGNKTPTASTRPSTSSGPTSTYTDSNFLTTSSSFSRKASFSTKSPKAYRGRNTSNNSATLSPEKPEKRANSTSTQTRTVIQQGPGGGSSLTVPVPDFEKSQFEKSPFDKPPKTADSFNIVAAESLPSPASDTNSYTSTTPFETMLARPGTSGASNGAPNFAPLQQPASPTMENITFQHIQETSSKRISTLDYLRKAYVKTTRKYSEFNFNFLQS